MYGGLPTTTWYPGAGYLLDEAGALGHEVVLEPADRDSGPEAGQLTLPRTV